MYAHYILCSLLMPSRKAPSTASSTNRPRNAAVAPWKSPRAPKKRTRSPRGRPRYSCAMCRTRRAPSWACRTSGSRHLLAVSLSETPPQHPRPGWRFGARWLRKLIEDDRRSCTWAGVCICIALEFVGISPKRDSLHWHVEAFYLQWLWI
jgi:hypothetical protein